MAEDKWLEDRMREIEETTSRSRSGVDYPGKVPAQEKSLGELAHFVVSWGLFIFALIGPLTVLNVIGVEMNVILGLTTILISGGSAVLYADYKGVSLGIDFDARWELAAFIGIGGGLISAVFGGGIVVLAAVLVSILIGVPLVFRYGESFTYWLGLHPGATAMIGGGGGLLAALYMYVIGVPVPFIVIMIGGVAAFFTVSDLRNHYIGALFTILWIFFGGTALVQFLSGSYLNFTFATNLITVLLISTYVIREEGWRDLFYTLRSLPGLGDAYFLWGVGISLLGGTLWLDAVFSAGTIVGGASAQVAAWLLFIGGLLIGPLHNNWLRTHVNALTPTSKSGGQLLTDEAADVERLASDWINKVQGLRSQSNPDLYHGCNEVLELLHTIRQDMDHLQNLGGAGTKPDSQYNSRDLVRDAIMRVRTAYHKTRELYKLAQKENSAPQNVLRGGLRAVGKDVREMRERLKDMERGL